MSQDQEDDKQCLQMFCIVPTLVLITIIFSRFKVHKTLHVTLDIKYTYVPSC